MATGVVVCHCGQIIVGISLNLILKNTQTLLVTNTKGELTSGIALLSTPPIPPHGFGLIFINKVTILVT